MPKFLVDGALLTCSKGTTPGSLKVLDPSVKGGGSPMANKSDGIPVVNIPCFGMCLGLPGSPPPPCMPGTSTWDTSSKVKIRGSLAINEKSSISCPVGGGTIKPSMPGQTDVRNTGSGGGASSPPPPPKTDPYKYNISDAKQQDDKENENKENHQKTNPEKEEKATGSYKEIKAKGLRDAHHVTQDAAVKDLPGYNRGDAPCVHLRGPANVKGTPHNLTRGVQRQRGGGTYGAERRIGYKALRRAGLSKEKARKAIQETDKYFKSIGVDKNTPTRIPGDRR